MYRAALVKRLADGSRVPRRDVMALRMGAHVRV
jgi:hypothetical protein